jgi:hypothetical protein
VGGLVGGAVVVVGAILVVILVVVSLIDSGSSGDTFDDSTGFDQFETIDPIIDDAGTDTEPAPPPRARTPAPAAGSPSPEMTPAIRAELTTAIKLADEAEILAYRTLNPGVLSNVYSGDLLARHMNELQGLRSNGVVAENILANQEFQSFSLSSDGQKAEVTFTERWSTNFRNPLTQQCVAHIHEHDVPQTAYLQRVGGRWMIYAVDQEPFNAVLVDCHPEPQP